MRCCRDFLPLEGRRKFAPSLLALLGHQRLFGSVAVEVRGVEGALWPRAGKEGLGGKDIG
jgi:hypothetical protein